MPLIYQVSYPGNFHELVKSKLTVYFSDLLFYFAIWNIYFLSSITAVFLCILDLELL